MPGASSSSSASASKNNNPFDDDDDAAAAAVAVVMSDPFHVSDDDDDDDASQAQSQKQAQQQKKPDETDTPFSFATVWDLIPKPPPKSKKKDEEKEKKQQQQQQQKKQQPQRLRKPTQRETEKINMAMLKMRETAFKCDWQAKKFRAEQRKQDKKAIAAVRKNKNEAEARFHVTQALRASKSSLQMMQMRASIEQTVATIEGMKTTTDYLSQTTVIVNQMRPLLRNFQSGAVRQTIDTMDDLNVCCQEIIKQVSDSSFTTVGIATDDAEVNEYLNRLGDEHGLELAFGMKDVPSDQPVAAAASTTAAASEETHRKSKQHS